MPPLPGKPNSLWADDTPARAEHAALSAPVEVDVAVVGGGITGISTALLLQRAGASVAVLEADRVGMGVTGFTTAKVSSAHGLIYAELAAKFGGEGAAIYAEANEAAIEQVAGWVRDEAIECDLRRKPAYVYAETPDDVGEVEREVEAALAAGLDVSYAGDVDLPWEVAGAIRYENQAEFHPRRYLLGLTAALTAAGGEVFERTRVLELSSGRPHELSTDHGAVRADHVVIATHYPILDRGLYFARLTPQRSYVIAARASEPLPGGMYLSTESPSRSVRLQPAPGGGEYLLIGGEGHKTGQGGPTSERYERLARWGRERFGVASYTHRWASQDNVSADGYPYVGPYLPGADRLWVATGFRKWGMTNGTAAAMMLSDSILGRENPWAPAFSANRFTPRAAAPKLVKENLNVGLHFAGDRAAGALTLRTADSLQRGEGAIVRSGLGQAAAYRDKGGEIHSVSPTCTHLGCFVAFNDGEATWDCPCHGSRFGVDGEVLQGPAVKPLPPA